MCACWDWQSAASGAAPAKKGFTLKIAPKRSRFSFGGAEGGKGEGGAGGAGASDDASKRAKVDGTDGGSESGTADGDVVGQLSRAERLKLWKAQQAARAVTSSSDGGAGGGGDSAAGAGAEAAAVEASAPADAAAAAEVDPLDMYMAEVGVTAVKQDEGVSKFTSLVNAPKVITLEDIMAGSDIATSDYPDDDSTYTAPVAAAVAPTTAAVSSDAAAVATSGTAAAVATVPPTTATATPAAGSTAPASSASPASASADAAATSSIGSATTAIAGPETAAATAAVADASATGADGTGTGTGGAEDASLAGLSAEEKKRRMGETGRVFYDDEGRFDIMEAAPEKSALEMLREKQAKKELKAVNHGAVQYAPFNKKFYIECGELKAMDPEAVKALRDELEIAIRGKNCPTPISSWAQCGLSEKIVTVLRRHHWDAPFAIQRQAVPAIMGGRDVIGVAKTGSGKTLAYLIPMFRHLMDQPPLADGEGPIALIMAPARELAIQVRLFGGGGVCAGVRRCGVAMCCHGTVVVVVGVCCVALVSVRVVVVCGGRCLRGCTGLSCLCRSMLSCLVLSLCVRV